jgi:RHS repeat-associated protein
VPFGEVLAFERGGDWYYMHGDALSSTQLVTDENGNQVARFIHGAWGEELYASESVPGVLENRFVGGLGCRKDAATGLIYMRHRWYDCQLQRFISRDPIGLIGGANLYAYPAQPNSVIDEFGLAPCGPTPDPRAIKSDWANHTHWNNDPADAPFWVPSPGTTQQGGSRGGGGGGSGTTPPDPINSGEVTSGSAPRMGGYPPNNSQSRATLNHNVTEASILSARTKKDRWLAFLNLLAQQNIPDKSDLYYFNLGAVGAAFHYQVEDLVKYAGLGHGYISDHQRQLVRRGYGYGCSPNY